MMIKKRNLRDNILIMNAFFALIIAMLIVPKTSLAQAYVGDAFGITPMDKFEKTRRAKWSGLQDILVNNSIESRRFIEPGKTDNMFTFIGPKSAVAGKDQLHAVTILQDSYGNLVANDIEMIYSLGLPKPINTVTQSGIADVLFLPLPIAGTFHTGATTKNKQSARAEYRIVPDLESINLKTLPLDRAPLPEAFADIESVALKDQYGNRVGDGVAFQLHLKHPNETTTLASGLTVSDVARARLLTRTLEPNADMSLWLGKLQSELTPFSYDQIILESSPKMTAFKLNDIDAIKLRIGPFLTTSGHILNDGTPVKVTVALAGDTVKKVDGWLRDGMFEAIFSGTESNLPAQITVEAEAQSGQFKLLLETLIPEQKEPEWRN